MKSAASPPSALDSSFAAAAWGGGATVAASTLWWAEAVAKAVVTSGRRLGRELLEQLGVNGVLESWDGAPRYDVIVTPVLVA